MKQGIIFLAIGLMVSLASCKKETEDGDDTTSGSSTQSTQDNNRQNNEWNDINSIVQNVMLQESSSLLTTATCATVTVNNVDSTIKIDFGTSGCTGTDGRSRKGIINVSYTKNYVDSGAVITTTLQDYYVDGNKIEGTKVVTNKGPNTNNDPYFTIEVTGGKITFTDGTFSTWESTRTRTWVAGDDTPGLLSLSDDIYEIYGTASGVNRAGLSYTMTVPSSDPLVVDIGCLFQSVPSRQPKDGTLTISPQGLDDRVIDYGEGGGDCDSEVRVTIGLFSFVLILI